VSTTTQLDPSIADMALYGHYAGMLHHIKCAVDHFEDDDQRWYPGTTTIQVCVPVNTEPPEGGGKEPRQAFGILMRELAASDVHNASSHGKNILECGKVVVLCSLKAAFLSAESNLYSVLIRLAMELFGKDKASDLEGEREERQVKRWERVAARIEASLTKEEKDKQEADQQASNERYQRIEAERQVRALKRLAEKLGEETTLKAAIEKKQKDVEG
jgi:hypothetical protein